MAEAEHEGGGGHSPLAQFEIKGFGADPHDLQFYSFTNSSLFMVLGLLVVCLILFGGIRRGALVPSRWQCVTEMSYEFVANMIRDNVGHGGRNYFPFIFTLFMFVLAGNMLGMLPYSFTYTSHIIVTFSMAIVIFVGVTVIAFMKHGLHFLHFFLPSGVPLALAPLMIVIEVLSYLTRPISLSVRLFANLTAGHTLLKVFAGFVAPLGVFGIVPLAVSSAVTILELVVAGLQAYVFTVLSCVYLNDALNMH